MRIEQVAHSAQAAIAPRSSIDAWRIDSLSSTVSESGRAVSESGHELPCDLCEGHSFEIIAHRDRHGRPLDTRLCRNCGLVSHASIPSEEDLAAFYKSRYRRQYHGEVVPSPRRVMRAWKNADRIFRQMSPFLSGNERLLDVGAGIGCTARRFQIAGFQAQGIDPGDDFLQYAQQSLKAPLSSGLLFDLPQAASYDAILLIHVIEHFRSPSSALRHLRSLLTERGQLYVECPNLSAPFARRGRLFHFAHIHNFTPETLEMLAWRCGFRLVRRFGSNSDPNLQMLLEVATPREHINPESYFRTQCALAKSHLLPYHLRLSYLGLRARQLASYSWEHLAARRYVRLLEDRMSRDLCSTPTIEASGAIAPATSTPTPPTRSQAA